MPVPSLPRWLRDTVVSPAHWLGTIDARPLALFRMLLGLVLLADLWGRAFEIRDFLTSDGIFPLPVAAAAVKWSLFRLTDATLPVVGLYLVGVAALIAFTIGYRTRLATLIAWVVLVSLHNRIPAIETGGDTLADTLLFLSLFTNPGAVWSLDAARAGATRHIAALVPRFMQYLPALVYLYTARLKLLADRDGWLAGPILTQHLQLHGWARPGGVWLRAHPDLCAALALGTIVAEFAIPLLLLVPTRVWPARAAALVSHVGLQLGILLTLKVGIFTNVMLAITALWIPAAWFDVPGARSEDPARTPWLRWTMPRAALAAAIAALCILSAVAPVTARHLPQWALSTLSATTMELKVGMFTHPYPSERWVAAGVLDDGRRVDPLHVAAPRADFSERFSNSAWMQLPYRLDDYAPLGRFVCRRYNARREGAALREWTLEHRKRPPYTPGAPHPAESSKVVVRARCDEPNAVATK